MGKRGPKSLTKDELRTREKARRQAVIGTPLTDKEIARFRAKVDTTFGADACWPWTAYCQREGYGRFMMRARDTGAHTAHGAHVVALWIELGRKPERHVLHSCDNPACCNPAHLREGTPSDNMRDAYDRGRKHPPQRRLTAQQVREIRQRAGELQHTLAAEYGVHQSTISNVLAHRSWRGVE